MKANRKLIDPVWRETDEGRLVTLVITGVDRWSEDRWEADRTSFGIEVVEVEGGINIANDPAR